MADTKVRAQDAGNRLFLPPCRVCGDKAAGFHYGVNTCEACKGFFHRSLRRYTDYKCRANRTSGYCEYKPGKRKSCQYCRYQRCLNAGMAKEAIKTGRYTYLKRTEDTQEIQRLQNNTHQVHSDGPDTEAVVSSAQSSLSSIHCANPDTTTAHRLTHVSMEVDSTTLDEGFAGSVSESDLSCSSSDFFNTRTDVTTSPFIFNSFKQNSNDTPSKQFCRGDQAQLTNSFACSSKNKVGNKTKQSSGDQIKSPGQSAISIKDDYTATSESCNDRSNSFTPLGSQESEATSHEGKDICSLSSQSLYQALESVQNNGRSVIYQLLSNTGSKHNREPAKNCIKNIRVFSMKQNEETNIKSQTEAAFTIQSKGSSVFETKLLPCNRSVSTSSTSKKASDKTSKDVTFDLFPDISFCLDGRPVSSPMALMSDEAGANSALTPPDLLSSMTSPRSDNTTSPVSSPGDILFNLDSGQHLKVGEDCCLESDLCQTPPSGYPAEDQTLIYDDDNITLQIMEEYTQGLDLIIDSSTTTQAPTPVEALLTSASPQDTRSGSPVSPFDSVKDDINDASPTTKLTNRVKELQLADVAELFGDMDAVISALVASHRENIGNFSYLSKEEMFAQQKAHCESCQLQRQTFGDLVFLPEHEYDDIYSITGIDIDNRRTIIQKYLARMEKCVRGLVHFAKSIPGFSLLDMITQVELIKLARSEIAIFTVYPTVNLELGVSLGLGGESWACQYDMRKMDSYLAIQDYMIFCDKLQKMDLSEAEEVILKAILVMSTDRDSTVKSPLAEEIRWQLILCLKHSLEKNRDTSPVLLARYILALTQSRTVSEKFKDIIRELKMHKYSSIEQNPLMWELFSEIFHEKEGNVNWSKFWQLVRDENIGLWSPCFLGDP